jgi:hypothetical protein
MIAPGNIYFISEHWNEFINHGGIGPVDIEKILLRNNAIPVRFPYHFDFSIKAKIFRLAYLLKTLVYIKAGSIVIFQHPVDARMNKMLLQLLRLRKRITIVCLVADIDGIKDGDQKLLQREKDSLSNYEYFILHNFNMHQWLKSFHPKANAAYLQFFDFLTNYKEYSRAKSTTVVFAGNLAKSLFLEKLEEWLKANTSIYLNLYGPFVSAAMLKSSNVKFRGLHQPYSLPDLIEGSFGLIWDGDDVKGPVGSLGNYMHYITHHKFSLYILCNLPVILYENAGSAEIVKKFKIGFTVKSLLEIEEKIHSLKDSEYNEMVINTRQLAKEITSGNSLQKALAEILSIIKENEEVN